jgi:hypothetical protein
MTIQNFQNRPCPFICYGVGPVQCPYLVNGDCDQIDINPGNNDSFCGAAVEAQVNAADALSKLSDITKRVESVAEGLEGIFERREKVLEAERQPLHWQDELDAKLDDDWPERRLHLPDEVKKEFAARGIAVDEATGAISFDALQGSQQPKDDADTKIRRAYETGNKGGKLGDVHGRTYRQVYEQFGHDAMVDEYLKTNSWLIK